MLFLNRHHAGKELAKKLLHFQDMSDAIVLALPRGGVPVAYEVAKTLNLSLDIFLVRKLGVPFHQELAMGAIASGGVRILNESVISSYRIDAEDIEKVYIREKKELERREKLYRNGQEPLDVFDKTVILVDDGLATGSTMLAAVQGVRKLNPKKIVVAAPVAAQSTCEYLQQIADEVVCCETPEDFFGVGMWYKDFTQTTDDEVKSLLEESRKNINKPA